MINRIKAEHALIFYTKGDKPSKTNEVILRTTKNYVVIEIHPKAQVDKGGASFNLEQAEEAYKQLGLVIEELRKDLGVKTVMPDTNKKT